jgi:hypothetical protein
VIPGATAALDYAVGHGWRGSVAVMPRLPYSSARRRSVPNRCQPASRGKARLFRQPMRQTQAGDGARGSEGVCPQVVGEHACFGHRWVSSSPSSPRGGFVAPVGTAPGAEGRPVELPVRGRPGRPVAGVAAFGRSADLLAPVGPVGSASCQCWQGQLEVRVLGMASGLGTNIIFLFYVTMPSNSQLQN